MAMTNAERLRKFRERQRAMKPKQEKPETKPMTNAERQKRHRDKAMGIKAEKLAAELEKKRNEIIQYVKTMSANDIPKLYKNTVEEQKLLDVISRMKFDIPGAMEYWPRWPAEN